MSINQTMRRLGEERSVIREIFEYGNARKKEIGADKVFDFSLGNPSVAPPPEVNAEIVRLIAETPSVRLHGYTSAAGAPEVRAAVAEYLQTAFGAPVSAARVYMTCGAAASLTISLAAMSEAGDEFVVVAPCFPEYRVFIERAGERIGYIAVPDDCTDADALFAAVCGAGRALGYVCAPALFQRVAAKCLGKSGDIAAYRENRDLLWNALRTYGFECVPPEGAFYLFVRSPEPDAKAFCARAKKYELLLVPSDSFGIPGYVRISYCVAKETIQSALPAFEKLAKEYGLR